MSAFMVPEVSDDAFILATDKRGEETLIPADCYDTRMFRTSERVTGWFVRLSAPGYLDSTEWQGPYPTETDARQAISDTFDVCGRCGEDLTDEAASRDLLPWLCKECAA